MKKYRLKYTINGRDGRVKYFATRNKAESYMGRVLLRTGLDVTDIIFRDNDHSQEFYCNDYSRFTIDRISA